MVLALIFLTSLLVVSFSIPSIINLAFKKRLFDNPTETRKIHKRIVPNFGGIAIFTGFLFSSSLFIESRLLPEGNILMAAGLILFMTGLKDDIVGLGPLVKFLAQTIAALITAMLADIRITSLHGFLGIIDLNYTSSIILTVIFIVGIVNAFNLIDGIDGLAASLGVFLSLVFAYLFWHSGDIGWSYLSLSLTGALIGFLFFNVTPARIFMGDSGSLLVGFVASILSVKFLNVSIDHTVMFGAVMIESSLSLILAILIIPIFDTMRVFTIRILKNTSPFVADSNHLHHRLLFIGFSHMQSALILAVVNMLFVVLALSFQRLGNTQLVGVIIVAILTANGLLSLYIEWYKKALLRRELAPKVVTMTFGEEITEKIKEN